MLSLHDALPIYLSGVPRAVPEARRARDGGSGMSGAGKGLLFDGSDWDFDRIRRVHEAVAEVAERTLKLDTYPNQIEVITAEQMLDAYSSTGMPLFYKHWSFGKQFVHHELLYRKGMREHTSELQSLMRISYAVFCLKKKK